MERTEGKEVVSRGGAGGKLTKRSLRTRVQATPYYRQPRGEARQREKADGWLSKLLVQPASWILPSFFSKHQDPAPPLPEPLPHSESEQEDCDAVSMLISDNQFFDSKEAGASVETGHPKVCPKDDELAGDQLRNVCDGSALNEIEQRLKQKMFTRDESNHLIELLLSRTTDCPNDGGNATEHGIDAVEGTLGLIDSRISAKEEHDMQIDCSMTRKMPDPFRSTPYSVSSSPVEIAKSYMEAQTSACDYNCQSGGLKNEKSSLTVENCASTLPFTSVAVVKSPICWPGAVVQRDHGYFTPQRGRIHVHPQNLHSGSIFPKSILKLQDGEGKPIFSSANWSKSSTHIFGSNTMKKRSSILGDGFSSVGPVGHVRQKDMAAIASKRVCSSSQTSPFTLQSNSADALNGLSSSIQGNFEHGSLRGSFFKLQPTNVGDEASRFTAHSLTVHPQSSEMAKKILEHLDRTVPSPNEKYLESKLAVSRSKVPPTTKAVDGQDKGRNVEISDEHEIGFIFRKDTVVQEGADAQKVLPTLLTSKFNDKEQLSSLAPTGKLGILGLVPSTTDNSAAFQIPSILLPPPCESTSISTVNHSEKLKSSENGPGFSFAVPAVSDAFSEPPTPTMNSFLPASKMVEVSEGGIPSFKFGSSRADGRLVFSFGSIVISSSMTDGTTPTFKFGSEKMSSLSVPSVNKESICY